MSVDLVKRVAFGGMLLLVAVAVTLVGLRAVRSDVVVGRNELIQIDDFALALNEAERVDDKYRLEFTVYNNAKRVDFDFSASQVLVLDADGTRLTTECVRQPPTLRAGANAKAVLLVDEKPAYVKWQFGGTVGGFIDDLFFRDKRINVGL